MKTVVRIMLSLLTVLLIVGCSASKYSVGEVTHDEALQALENKRFEIVIEEIYYKFTYGNTQKNKPLMRYASECRFAMSGDKVSYYISSDDLRHSKKTLFPERAENVPATLTKGKEKKNGDVEYFIHVESSDKHFRSTSDFLLVLYKKSNICFVSKENVFGGHDISFRGRLKPL